MVHDTVHNLGGTVAKAPNQTPMGGSMTKTSQAELLNLLKREKASPITWETLCEQLDQDSSLLESKRLHDLLDGWDDDIRVLPERWLEVMLSGQDVPKAAIAREIHADSSDLGDAELEALAASPQLEHIKALWLAKNQIGDEGMLALMRSHYIDNLRIIDVRENKVGFEGIDAILRHPELPRQLHILDISGNADLANADFHGRLGRSRKLIRLRSLALDDLAFDEDAIRIFAYARVFNRLQSLSLRRNLVNDEAVAYLARSPYLGKLRSLDLSDQGGAGLTSKALVTIGSSRVLSELTELSLSGAWIDDQGIAEFSTVNFMKNLEHLDLGKTGVSPEGADVLFVSKKFPALQTVTLSRGVRTRADVCSTDTVQGTEQELSQPSFAH